ncbi:hypothetical protein M3Y99_00781000 [Aphelenchoides fujianensis]|nr:hypothetical protein M3Y99_00781000 [Aphelenchoides fujianensis]
MGNEAKNGNESGTLKKLELPYRPKLGTTFNYTHYFARRRDRYFKKKVAHALDFIERLDFAIQISIRMTGQDATKALNFYGKRRLPNNKQCNVCHLVVWSDCERFTTYFRARKIRATKNNKFAKDGYFFEWLREGLNQAEQIDEHERCSGPLVLCTQCNGIMLWYEQQIHWRFVRTAMRERDFANLPPICGVYAKLFSALQLCQFFANEKPEEHKLRLAEIKRCVTSCCTDIAAISTEIENLGKSEKNEAVLFQKRREFLIQRNIAQFCAYIIAEANLLISFDPQVPQEIVMEVEGAGCGMSIWEDLCRLFAACRPLRYYAHAAAWSKESGLMIV